MAEENHRLNGQVHSKINEDNEIKVKVDEPSVHFTPVNGPSDQSPGKANETVPFRWKNWFLANFPEIPDERVDSLIHSLTDNDVFSLKFLRDILQLDSEFLKVTIGVKSSFLDLAIKEKVGFRSSSDPAISVGSNHANGANATPSRISPSKMIHSTIINLEFKRLKNRKVYVTYNVGDTASKETIDSWEALEQACREGGITSTSWLRKKYPLKAGTVQRHQSLLHLVNSNSESIVQELLSREMNDYLIDTSKVSHGLLSAACEAKYLNLDDSNPEVVHLNTARVDLIGKRSATLVELKAHDGNSKVPSEKDPKYKTLSFVALDMEGFSQSITRLTTLIDTNALLTNVVVVCVTPHFAFYFTFTRDIHTRYGESVEIRRVLHSDVERIILAREQEASNPKMNPLQLYYTPDAPLILNAVARITDPSLCGSQLKVWKEECRIYSYSLPRLFRYASNDSRELGVDLKATDFVIKVCASPEEYEAEVQALSVVAPAYNRHALTLGYQNRFHYALSHCSAAECSAAAAARLSSGKENLRAVSNGGKLPAKPSKAQPQVQVAGTSRTRSAAKVAPTSAQANAKVGVPFTAATSTADCESSLKMVTEGFAGLNIKEGGLLMSEKEALAALSEQFDHAKRGPYRNLGKLAPITPPHKSPCSWLSIERLLHTARLPTENGCILMRKGTPFCEQSALTKADWFSDVMMCIDVNGSVGLVQTDVRKENTLVFDNAVQLIDYGLAARAPKGYAFVKFAEGAQYDQRGYRLRLAKVGDTVKWTLADDVEMMLNTYNKL